MAKADPKQTHIATTWKHGRPLITCRFHPGGTFVFISAEDMTVQRWEIGAEKSVPFAGPHDSWVRGIGFADGGNTLITAGYDGRVAWWPALGDKPEPIRVVDAHDGWIRFLSMTPDGQAVVTAGNDNAVKLWNAADGKLIREFSGHEKHVYSTFNHPAGEFLLSGDLNGTLIQWKVADGSKVRTFDAKELHTFNTGQGVDYGGVRSIDLSPDGRLIAASGLHKATNPLGAVNEPIVVVFDWESGKKVRSQIAEGVKGIAWRSVYHPAGFLIGASGGSGGGYLLFWNPTEDKSFHKLKLPNTARDLDLHPDGMQIATAHHDGQLRISRMEAKAG